MTTHVARTLVPRALLLAAAVLGPASPTSAQHATAAEIAAGCGRTAWPETRWSWLPSRDAPDYPQFCGTALVVQVTDDDGDGLVGPGDIADVVVVHDSAALGSSRLTVIDGATGVTAWSSPVPVGRRIVAAADVDRDGRVEFAALRPSDDGVILLDHDGSLMWDTALPPPSLQGSPLGFADLDQDGVPEIFSGATVLDASGALRFRGTLGQGGLLEEHVSHALDLHPSPGLELLAGNTLYASDGSVLWSNPALPDGFTGVGDLDGDGVPEIVVCGTGFLQVVNALTGSEGAPHFLTSTRPLSSPLIADFDADGRQEVFVASQSAAALLAFAGTGVVALWEIATHDESCCSGASAFDFDGDGHPEILYRDERALRILDASTGAPLFERGGGSATGLDYPYVVDLDGDGSPELLTASCGRGVDVYACPCTSRARRIWNQHSYHVTNIDDDATVPVVEAAPTIGWGVQSRGPLEACEVEPPRLECATCEELYRTVNEASIDVEGVRTSLLAKVDAACRALERNRRNAATNVLCALLAETYAQDGRHVEPVSAQHIRDCVRSFADAQHLMLRSRDRPRRFR